jgi:hypothetical protein
MFLYTFKGFPFFLFFFFFWFLLLFTGALSHGKAIEELCLPFSYNSFYKFIGALLHIYIYIYKCQEISVFYITLENK